MNKQFTGLKSLGVLARDVLVYGIAAGFSKIFSLISFPILTRHFSVEVYGEISFYTSIGSMLAIAFVFGQDSSVGRYFYKFEAFEERRRLVSESLMIQILLLLLIIPLVWIFSSYISGSLYKSTDSAYVFSLVVLQTPFVLLMNFSRNLLKWTFARTRFLIISLGFPILYLLMLLCGVFFYDINIRQLFVLITLANILFGFLGIFFVRQWLLLPKTFDYLRPLILFAIPYGVIAILASVVPVFEKYLAVKLVGAEAMGLYSAGAAIAALVSLGSGAFQTAWGPFALSIHKKNVAGQTYNLVFKCYVVCTCFGILMLTGISDSLISVLSSDRYLGAVVVVFPIAMGLGVFSIGWITDIGIALSEKSYLSLYENFIFVLMTLVGIFLFTSIFGLVGVAIGVMVGYSLKTLVASIIAQKTHPLPWSYVGPISILFITMIFGLMHTWMVAKEASFYFSPILFCTLAAFFVLSLGFVICLNNSDRVELRRSILKYIK